ncbi:uncharacterized protein LOC129570308 [Sitodiplosis mosellana]|uniref:uncharacterized protein LOC129570308 n=1 Tax=Sitodiplosis mosellana TaxID=263140 RepID=UPI002443A76A|nr:uncharacterized protein LOC129570308 [Sitodiplosis mosellana]
MPLPTVNSCVCLRLRTAGLVMGVIAISVDLVSVGLFVRINQLNHNTDNSTEGIWELAVTTICLVIAVAWVYGIICEKTSPMLPFLVVSFVGVIVFVFLPFISLFYFSNTNADPIKGTIIFFFLCYIGGLAGYTWVVQYSLYKQVEEITIEKHEERNGV